MRSLRSFFALLLICAAAVPSGADPLNEPAAELTRPERGLISAAVRVNGGIVAVGARGLILRLDGDGWRQAPMPVRRTLTAIAAGSDGRLVAVGHDALVLESVDAGATWRVVRADPDFDAPLLDLWLGADGRGLTVGAYGLAFSTEDHGRTWARREIDPEEPHFYAIRQAADGTLFIAGEFGTFLRSRDGGATWKRLHTGYEGTFFGLRPGRDGRLLLHGLRGRLFESNDGGETWRSLDSGVTAALYDAVYLPDGRAVVVGDAGTVLMEEEAGSGSMWAVPLPRRGAITTVLVAGPDAVLLFGEDGVHRLILPAAAEAGDEPAR